MEIFLLPTNRNIGKAVASIILEIECFGEESIILVIDNSTNKIQKQNQLISEAYKNEKIDIVWFGINAQIEFIKHLSEKCEIEYGKLYDLIFTVAGDYGKIFNMGYLLVAAMGESSFHRRDSDCYVFNIQKSGYPIIMEKRYLNKRIKETDIYESMPQNYDNNELINIVGSDYFGNWNLDLQDLDKENKEVLNIIMSLSNIRDEEKHKYIESKYYNCDMQYCQRPFFDHEEGVYQWLEMGNVSMYNIFKLLPNFIGLNAVGFDYHVYNMAYYFEIPMIYHPNKIQHVYGGGRKNKESLKAYWKGICKMNDYNLVMAEFCRKYSGRKGQYGFIEGIVRGKIYNTFMEVLDEIDINKRMDIINTIINRVLLASCNNNYRVVGQYLETCKMQIIEEVNCDYINSLKLLEIWKRLIYECDKNSQFYLSQIKGKGS